MVRLRWTTLALRRPRQYLLVPHKDLGLIPHWDTAAFPHTWLWIKENSREAWRELEPLRSKL